eukprot:TRINITY_DN15493_c0_g1_i1.p1 TRINITY_DN15493_c0_g1~~TRINITY_DN15493_c0_g1_i1.p1  ORF type:complete len:310 (-),score=153.56 TRINITY_DN15493_c0_g1_i1:45-974(-)
MPLQFKDQDSIRTVLADLRSSETTLNWVLFKYVARETLELESAGEGGLEELVQSLGPTDIKFALLEVVVTDEDQYNAVKFVLITWIGPEVSAGIAKASAAGHRRDVIDFVQVSLAIASEFQPSGYDDLNLRSIASKITRVSESYQDGAVTGEKKETRQQLSRSEAASRNTKLSQISLINEGEIIDAFKAVAREDADWAVVRYSEGKKDELELKSVGKGGLDGLKAQLVDSEICFALIMQKVTETTTTVTKILLVTWVGEQVRPLQKARSSPHRDELANWLKQHVPFHSHYPATSYDDLTVESILFKIRS